MGAAASVQQVYQDAIKWFGLYIDKETYYADFQSLDKDSDGGVSYGELSKWIKGNVKDNPNSCWSLLQANPIVIKISHKAAAAYSDSTSSVGAKDVVDVNEFKALLIHLFATSILWRHFAAVNKWKDDGSQTWHEEVFSKKLDIGEFKVAVRSLCTAHMNEELSDEQLETEFNDLDTNYEGKVGFVQLCTHCVKFIGAALDSAVGGNAVVVNSKAGSVLGVSPDANAPRLLENTLGTMKERPKQIFDGITVQERNELAMHHLELKLQQEDAALAQFHDNLHNKQPPVDSEILSDAITSTVPDVCVATGEFVTNSAPS